MKLSARAEADLSEIWDYSAERWGLTQAEAYVRAMWQALEQLDQAPQLGRRCDEIRPGYFKYRSGSHLIFYRRLRRGIFIVRILHANMDYERRF